MTVFGIAPKGNSEFFQQVFTRIFTLGQLPSRFRGGRGGSPLLRAPHPSPGSPHHLQTNPHVWATFGLFPSAAPPHRPRRLPPPPHLCLPNSLASTCHSLPLPFHPDRLWLTAHVPSQAMRLAQLNLCLRRPSCSKPLQMCVVAIAVGGVDTRQVLQLSFKKKTGVGSSCQLPKISHVFCAWLPTSAIDSWKGARIFTGNQEKRRNGK